MTRESLHESGCYPIYATRDQGIEALEFVQRIECGEDVRSLETQRISKDGRTLDVWLTVTKLVDDVGIGGTLVMCVLTT